MQASIINKLDENNRTYINPLTPELAGREGSAQIVERNTTFPTVPKPALIRLMELEICTKTLQNFSEKLRGKFPLSTLCWYMVSSSCLVNAFLEPVLLERSLVKGQKLQQKQRKKRKRKSENKTKRRKD